MKGKAIAAPALASLLIAAAITLIAGYMTKQACFALGHGESFYCFSDYGPVYYARQLAGGRFPYFPPALEYPAGTGLLLWAVSALSVSPLAFWFINVAIASAAAFAIVALLWRVAPTHAMLFAAAPTLALYAFLNWDLVALVWAVAAIVAFLRNRDRTAGALLGIGIAMKAFPALLLIPMMAERRRTHDRRGAVRIGAAAGVVAAVINLPVALATVEGWLHFARFNTARAVDWNTLWSAGCQLSGAGLCANVPLVNTLSLAAFVVTSAVAWWLIVRAAPAIPRWHLGLVLTVLFFLTNKVYSPQYSLWILPWFVFALPDIRLFVAYEAIDIGIYVTGFAWQQRLAGSGGLPLWPLHVFVVARAVVLIAMLAALALRGREIAAYSCIRDDTK